MYRLDLHVPAVRSIAFLAIRDWRFVGPITAGDAIRIIDRGEAVTSREARPARQGRKVAVEVVNERN